MNLLQKTAATTATALAVGVGTYLAVSDPADTISNNPDIYVPTIPVAEVKIAEIYTPTIPVAKIYTPEISKANIYYITDSSEDIYVADIYKSTIPTADIRYVSYESSSDVYESHIDISKVDLSKIEINSADIKTYLMDSYENAKIQKGSVKTVSIYNPTDSIKKSQVFYALFQQYFKDNSLLQHDTSINRNNPYMLDWINIAKQSIDYTQSFIPMPSNIKAIAEIHHPINVDVLNSNLELYSQKGYTHALITFGYTGEDINKLCAVADLIRSKGMRVLLAYAGPESHSHPVLADPSFLEYAMYRLAAVSDGLLLGWRRTSLHLYTQDIGFTNFLIKTARSANPNIFVIGEAYYGDLNNSGLENKKGLGYNIPTNSSGVLITGLGYNRIAVEAVTSNLLKDIKDYNRMVLVVGSKPYYNTVYNTNLDFAENLKIKESIAKRWSRAGVTNAIILHGDGSDGKYDQKYTDNLAYTKY